MKKVILSVCVMLATVVILLFVVVGARSLSAQGKSPSQKWEYCAITSVGATRTSPQKGTVTISYFSDTGQRRENLEGTVETGSGLSFADVFARAIAKLGQDGWELVLAGKCYTDTGPKEGVLYFRRVMP